MPQQLYRSIQTQVDKPMRLAVRSACPTHDQVKVGQTCTTDKCFPACYYIVATAIVS